MRFVSPGNRPMEITRKLGFYQRYGVEECYLYDPDPADSDLSGWHVADGAWRVIPSMRGWISPRLGVRFDLEGGELVLVRPDGRRFASFLEIEEQRAEARLEADRARREADQARRRAERLAAQLRAMGVEPDAEP